MGKEILRLVRCGNHWASISGQSPAEPDWSRSSKYGVHGGSAAQQRSPSLGMRTDQPLLVVRVSVAISGRTGYADRQSSAVQLPVIASDRKKRMSAITLPH